MAATCDSVMAIDTATGEPEFRRADCQFSYRDSVFKRPPAGVRRATIIATAFAITRVRFVCRGVLSPTSITAKSRPSCRQWE